MNYIQLSVVAFGSILLVISSQAQGFVNLDFASANVSGHPANSIVPFNAAIPGWTGYLGTNQQTTVLYNSLDAGSANVAILDTNYSFPLLVIPGSAYTVVLQAGDSSDGNKVSASIAQTALIPLTAKALLFSASMPYQAGWQVTVAGENIPVTQISMIGNNYAIFGGDISAFAGQVDELEFTALTGAGAPVNMYLDSISFSSSPVPEPSALGLSALGGLFLARRRWKTRTEKQN